MIPLNNDNPKFIALVNCLLERSVASELPGEVHLIRIDGWFDAKWLNFSGKALGAVGVWSKTITVPPFHPNRVLAEIHLATAAETGDFVPISVPPLHLKQSSECNLNRSIAKVSPSAIFFWYSSVSENSDRGSVMLYRTRGVMVSSWYASFARAPKWRLDRHRGISPEELQLSLSL